MKYQPAGLLFLLGLFQQPLQSQQLPLFAQYREMHGLLNPASLPPDYLLYDQPSSLGISVRSQWAKAAEGPKTQLIHLEHLFEQDYGALLPGLTLMNDQAGMVGLTGVYGRLAAVVSNDPFSSGIAVGLQAGLVQYRVNLEQARLHDPEDLEISGRQVQWFPDVGAGVYYYKRWQKSRLKSDLLWAGFSIPQVLGLDLRFRDESGSFEMRRLRHFYGHAGYNHALDHDGAFIEFSSWLKYVQGAPVHADFNFRYQLNNAFWLGAGGSTAKALHTEFGIRLDDIPGDDNTLRIGYSFDYWFARFGPELGGAHELTVGIGFGG